MNRIDRLFRDRKGEILSIYMTAGYPSLADGPRILGALQDAGADLVEIGMPFSDPLADGPVIQESSQIALSNGMSLKVLFGQLEGIRESIHLPLILMGYLNPILQFGMEEFLEKCASIDVDGLIIPDLPADEYKNDYLELFEKYGIYNILLISPHTTEDRIRKIDSLSRGFLYLVADASTTGAKSSLEDHQLQYFQRIREMDLKLPCLAGFGISNHETFTAACSRTRGAIIGSAFIRALGEGKGSLEEKVHNFITAVRKG